MGVAEKDQIGFSLHVLVGKRLAILIEELKRTANAGNTAARSKTSDKKNGAKKQHQADLETRPAAARYGRSWGSSWGSWAYCPSAETRHETGADRLKEQSRPVMRPKHERAGENGNGYGCGHQ